MAVNDIYKVTLSFGSTTGDHTSRLYFFETVEASSLAPESALAVAFVNQGKDLIRALLTNEFGFNACIVEKMHNLRRPKYIRQVTGGSVGTAAGTSLPTNNSTIMSLSQARYSPKSNGRCYFPPPPEGQTAGGVLLPAFMASAWDPFISWLLSGISPDTGTGQWFPCVISQKILNAAPPAKDWAGALCPVVSAGVEAVVGIQRRRMSKREGWFSAT